VAYFAVGDVVESSTLPIMAKVELQPDTYAEEIMNQEVSIVWHLAVVQ
jgi:hypothetical protein